MHFNLTFMNENSNPGNMGQIPAGGGPGTQNDNTQYVGGPTGPSVPPPPYGPQGFGPQGFGPQMGPHATVVPAPPNMRNSRAVHAAVSIGMWCYSTSW